MMTFKGFTFLAMLIVVCYPGDIFGQSTDLVDPPSPSVDDSALMDASVPVVASVDASPVEMPSSSVDLAMDSSSVGVVVPSDTAVIMPSSSDDASDAVGATPALAASDTSTDVAPTALPTASSSDVVSPEYSSDSVISPSSATSEPVASSATTTPSYDVCPEFSRVETKVFEKKRRVQVKIVFQYTFQCYMGYSNDPKTIQLANAMTTAFKQRVHAKLAWMKDLDCKSFQKGSNIVTYEIESKEDATPAMSAEASTNIADAIKSGDITIAVPDDVAYNFGNVSDADVYYRDSNDNLIPISTNVGLCDYFESGNICGDDVCELENGVPVCKSKSDAPLIFGIFAVCLMAVIAFLVICVLFCRSRRSRRPREYDRQMHEKHGYPVGYAVYPGSYPNNGYSGSHDRRQQPHRSRDSPAHRGAYHSNTPAYHRNY